MCILLTSTGHPDYPFVLLSNRDEYFIRPTRMAQFRPLRANDGSDILCPLDLARPEHGTWIGVSTSGKIAVLLNYRDQDAAPVLSEISRGIIPLEFLEANHIDDDKWQENLINVRKVDMSKIGGFTLVYGTLSIDSKTQKIGHLNLISNRGDHGTVHDLKHTDFQETFGISNSLHTNPWKKVDLGTSALKALIDKNISNQEDLVEECFKLLSTSTYDEDLRRGTDWIGKMEGLRNSVFIPPIEGNYTPNLTKSTSNTVGKFYGTRTQTVILLDKKGQLNYYERDLHNLDSDEVNKDLKVNHYSFNISNNAV